MPETTTNEMKEALLKQELLINTQREEIEMLSAAKKKLEAMLRHLYEVHNLTEFDCY